MSRYGKYGTDKDLLSRAVHRLQTIGEFTYKEGDKRHMLDTELWGRVQEIFGLGYESSIELCQRFGLDPYHSERKQIAALEGRDDD